jgi:hypothetical protein
MNLYRTHINNNNNNKTTMKKSIHTLMMIVFGLLLCLPFTSCGGGSDDATEEIEQDTNNDPAFKSCGFTMNGFSAEGESWAWMSPLRGGIIKYYGKVGTYNKVVVLLYGAGTYNESTDTFSLTNGTFTFAFWVSKGNTTLRSGTYSALSAADASMTKWHFSTLGSTSSYFGYSGQTYALNSGIVKVTVDGSNYTFDFTGTTGSENITIKAYFSGIMTYVDKSK